MAITRARVIAAVRWVGIITAAAAFVVPLMAPWGKDLSVLMTIG